MKPERTFINVLLPAPFSPRMPWIVPASTLRLIPSLAWTGPNHFWMFLSSTSIGDPEPLPYSPPAGEVSRPVLQNDGAGPQVQTSPQGGDELVDLGRSLGAQGSALLEADG